MFVGAHGKSGGDGSTSPVDPRKIHPGSAVQQLQNLPMCRTLAFGKTFEMFAASHSTGGPWGCPHPGNGPCFDKLHWNWDLTDRQMPPL